MARLSGSPQGRQRTPPSFSHVNSAPSRILPSISSLSNFIYLDEYQYFLYKITTILYTTRVAIEAATCVGSRQLRPEAFRTPLHKSPSESAGCPTRNFYGLGKAVGSCAVLKRTSTRLRWNPGSCNCSWSETSGADAIPHCRLVKR